MPRPDYPYHSLEDFLIATMSHVDGQLNDGFGQYFPVKGREIDATVLFADISGFSARTLGLTPVETLVFVNNFFAWITAEALHGRPGIVDKYIGDEVMVVFSEEFGSEDPFLDAVQAARAMSDHDVHSYNPHIGIASGPVVIGYVGTALKYSASAFGAPVALAARCAGQRPSAGVEVSSSIVFPSSDWGEREFSTAFPDEQWPKWELQPVRTVEMKNLPPTDIREVYNLGMRMGTMSATERAQRGVEALKEVKRYWPRDA